VTGVVLITAGCFVLTKHRFDPNNARMPAAPAPLIRRVQRAYPQIYLACHVRHRADHGLSERDARVLAHLDELAPVTPTELARHLGVGGPTVSEAIDHLEGLGLATRSRGRRDRRRVELRITAAGVARMQASSVLDSRRLAQVIARIPARRRAAAVRGLEEVAAAARLVMRAEGSRP
jgi:DNA-binding MarR family transcriptional regulator